MIYVSFSDRWVFYASHDWPNSNVCVTVGCRLATITNERTVRIGSLLLNKKYVLKQLLRGQNVFVNLRLVFQSLPIAADALPRILQSSRQF